MAMTSAEHDELREQAELYVLGALTSADRAAFEAHMASCAECTASVKSLSPVADVARQQTWTPRDRAWRRDGLA